MYEKKKKQENLTFRINYIVSFNEVNITRKEKLTLKIISLISETLRH